MKIFYLLTMRRYSLSSVKCCNWTFRRIPPGTSYYCIQHICWFVMEETDALCALMVRRWYRQHVQNQNLLRLGLTNWTYVNQYYCNQDGASRTYVWLACHVDKCQSCTHPLCTRFHRRWNLVHGRCPAKHVVASKHQQCMLSRSHGRLSPHHRHPLMAFFPRQPG